MPQNDFGNHISHRPEHELSLVMQADGLVGVPIGFLMTAIQQWVAFAVFCCLLAAGRVFRATYEDLAGESFGLHGS